jgi:hypothetical protein
MGKASGELVPRPVPESVSAWLVQVKVYRLPRMIRFNWREFGVCRSTHEEWVLISDPRSTPAVGCPEGRGWNPGTLIDRDL